MPESPPKRITRSRAKAAEIAKLPSKAVKTTPAASKATGAAKRKTVPEKNIEDAPTAKLPGKAVKMSTPAPKPTSTVRTRAVPDKNSEDAPMARPPGKAVNKSTPAPKPTSTVKTRAVPDKNTETAQLAKLPSKAVKVSTPAPKPTRTATKRKAVPDEGTADAEPVKKTRGRPKKATGGTDKQTDAEATNKPKPAAPQTVQPAKRPRGRPKKIEEQDVPKAEAPAPPLPPAPVPTERFTRGRMASATRGIAPVKKKVTFADDCIDKENQIPPRAATKRSADVTEDDAVKEPRGLNAKPIRRATSTKSTRAKKADTVAASKEPEKTEVKPLSPKKVQQNSVPDLSSPPKRPPPSPFKDALKESPKKINLSTSFLSQSPSKSTVLAQPTVEGLTSSLSPKKVQQNAVPDLSSPPKRPPPSPFKDALKDSPKKINLSTSFLSQSASKSTTPVPAVESLTPPKADHNDNSIHLDPSLNLSTSLLSPWPSTPVFPVPSAEGLTTPKSYDAENSIPIDPSINLSILSFSQSPSKCVFPVPSVKGLTLAQEYGDEEPSIILSASLLSQSPSESVVSVPSFEGLTPSQVYGDKNAIQIDPRSSLSPSLISQWASESAIPATTVEDLTTPHEYGDENSIPIDPILLKLTAKQQASRSATPTCTPARVFCRPQVIHTVCKVPLKAPAEETPMGKRPIKRSKSLGGGPLSPREVSQPLIPSKRNVEEGVVPSSSKKRRISEVLSEEDEHTPTKALFQEQLSTIDTPMRTPRPEGYFQILKGAVVFVDVHTSEGADASALFVELLTQMGARCVKQWNWNPSQNTISNGDSPDGISNIPKIGITHVVFKDGGKRTLEKVRESKGVVLCVGVSWVLDCERHNSWLDESTYAVDTSVIPRGGQRRRKSMEPRALSSTTTTPAMSSSSITRQFLNLDYSSPASDFNFNPTNTNNIIPTPKTPHFPATSSYSYISNEETTITTPYFLKPSQIIQQTCPAKPTHVFDFTATNDDHQGRPKRPLNFDAAVSGVDANSMVQNNKKRSFDSQNDEDDGDDDHQRQTKKPKMTMQPAPSRFPITGKIEDCPNEQVRARLVAARRKTLMWAPKVGSPLRQFMRRD